jgi:CMP/dCMP kinase
VKIAISGKSGCGNTTVSRLVAERLQIRWINYTFRMMAHDKGLTFDELRALAEQDDAVDRELDAHQVALAREGDCVLGSRLAIWMLEEADLKVFLDASDEVRAMRVLSREGGSREEKIRETAERDLADSARYMRIYGIDNTDTSAADMIIDTEQYTPRQIADLIIEQLMR